MKTKQDYADEAWNLLCKQSVASFKKQDWSEAMSISRKMAQHVEAEGKDASYLWDDYRKFGVLSHRETLMSFKDSQATQAVEVLANKGCCDSCLRNKGSVQDIDVAIEEKVLPLVECTGENRCRCRYLPVIDELY